MERHSHAGFTLIELLVALTVLSILLSIGLPSFSDAISNSRISSQSTNTTSALFIARSEAVKSSANVTVCARAENQSRTCKPTDGDWSHGLVVFLDNAPTAPSGSANVGPEDTVLHVEPELSGDNTLVASGSVNNTASGKTPTSYISYNPNGSTNWRGASLTICDSRGASFSRVINVVITGDIRRGRIPEGGNAPIDTYGGPAICP